MSFELSENQYKSILARLTVLERHANNLTTALENLASLSQVNELHVVYESKIRTIQEDIEAVVNRLNIIQEYHE